jgi:hypothetical protein
MSGLRFPMNSDMPKSEPADNGFLDSIRELDLRDMTKSL